MPDRGEPLKPVNERYVRTRPFNKNQPRPPQTSGTGELEFYNKK